MINKSFLFQLDYATNNYVNTNFVKTVNPTYDIDFSLGTKKIKQYSDIVLPQPTDIINLRQIQ